MKQTFLKFKSGRGTPMHPPADAHSCTAQQFISAHRILSEQSLTRIQKKCTDNCKWTNSYSKYCNEELKTNDCSGRKRESVERLLNTGTDQTDPNCRSNCSLIIRSTIHTNMKFKTACFLQHQSKMTKSFHGKDLSTLEVQAIKYSIHIRPNLTLIWTFITVWKSE